MYRIAPLLTFALSLAALPVLAQDVSESSQFSLQGFGVEEAHLHESLKQHLENLEGYVGLYQGQLRELLGKPQRSGVEAEGVPEREALLWFYDFQLTDSNVVH